MTRHLQFRVEDELYRACESAAEARGISLNAYGAQMVAEWLGRTEKEPQQVAVPRKYQSLMKDLARILASGEARKISAVTVVIESLLARLDER